MSLQTPEAIRRLQRKLYRKAKDEPEYRFYLLYDKIYREDILAHAYELAKANQGAPGVDGQTFAEIETQGREKWLKELGNELRGKRYKPQPVRRVMIPKPGAGNDRWGFRPFGTGWCRPPPNSSWNRYSKLIWTPLPTATGRDAARDRRSRRC
jgi:retron-type reverse transcriptase